MTAKRVFLAATGQNRGKTTTSLGLLAAIRDRGLRLGFVKPVGQRYLVVDGTRADEDAVFMSEVFGLPDPLDDMSPVTLPRHFTTDFIMGNVSDDLGAQVEAAFARLAADKDIVVVEGTGHAGVGAVVGLSNARAAAHAGRAGDHRQRGRDRTTHRRDRAEPRAVRRAGSSRCSARW